ncbi:uncharacterized protein Z518_06927 [Rhinocladiella mackenziei CBS 650.93]|uniref:Transcription elongation factor Eaf N-terminal domain-containing protein n=1 Tax=Rhinocladiella mackenziei CBS 650.93 TaxID=1442369 RepID=A0A0D2J326_9EURO|nr:uncharacterized protein Z518_06927 [Rhinocladiella mackenziei CBS 650.93]KIX03375.1 hypothetical protein Z518_06927 [Rhinocladiella mackenziei CBS 650.93]
MASSAIHPIRSLGFIDPRRPGEYPIILGETLKESSKSKDSLVNIRYNWQPKSGFGSRESKLTKSGDTCQLVVEDGGSDDGGAYEYTGILSSLQPGKSDDEPNSLALIFDKSKSAFVLESISASLDMNLRSGPGQSSKDTRQLPQLPTEQHSFVDSSGPNGDGHTSPSAEDETPDASNPYDFRHFLNEARENFERSAQQPGNRTPLPGSRTPLSGISTPLPGSSRFLATTPQFKPTPAMSKATPERKKKNEETTRNAGRTHPTSTKSKTTTKHETGKSSSIQPLSKARISDSDGDDSETIDVARVITKSSTTSNNSTTQKSSHAAGKGHTRNVSANIGRSPHIIINDDGGLEIDMGSPPPEDRRAKRGRVDPEMFRSHTGTPIGGISSNPHVRPESRPVGDQRGRGRDRDHDVTMKDIEAGSSPSDEDGDVEEFALGSPREKRLSVPNSGDVSRMDDEGEDDGGRRRHAPTPPAPASNDDDDDEDLLAAELEAALEEEDEEATRGIGLGIGMGVQDDESEVSEEE